MPVIRINNEKLHKEAKELCMKNNQSLAEFTEEALEKLINERGYDYDSLIELVRNSPLLSIYEDIIKHEFNGAPPPLIKNIVEIIKSDKKEIRFYKFILDKNYLDNLKKIFSSEINEAFLIMKINPKKEFYKGTEEIIDLIANCQRGLGKKEIQFNIAQKKDALVGENPELLIFVSYKKKESENEKK